MFLYGGDYNPEQWLDSFDTIKNDIKKFKEAGINTVTIGMFNWKKLEPSDSTYDFEWLIKVLDILKEEDFLVIFGTPTSARPHWLAQKYPETSRVNEDGLRVLSGTRNNECMTNPIMRMKVENLLEKVLPVVCSYSNIHSFHINNEYSGSCYCQDCKLKFHNYLQQKYKTIENLNKSFWNSFWSHEYNSFEEIELPFKHGERSNTSLMNNWKQFETESHMDNYMYEYEIIRRYSQLQITTNFHASKYHIPLDYHNFSKVVDYISFDHYPEWNVYDNYDVAVSAKTQMMVQSSLSQSKDFYMMETSPSGTNWQDYTMMKSDKLHYASMFLQLMCGTKSLLYFQLKQSRGSSEKYHGSVLDINSDDSKRVYKYCKTLGMYLKDINQFSAAKITKEIAVYLDFKNLALLKYSDGPRNMGYNELEFLEDISKYFINVGLNIEFVYDAKHFSKYKYVIIPYGYHIKTF